jgi:hypothetical protein
MAFDKALPLSMTVVALPHSLRAMDAAAFRYALHALE